MTIRLKTTDSRDVIQYTALTLDKKPFNLADATSVRFLMANRKTGALVANGEAEIVDAAKGRIDYALAETDTLRDGVFHAEFQIDFANGTRKTLPSEGYILVSIERNLDADQTTVIEDSIAIKVSEIEAFKTEIDARVVDAETEAAKVTLLQTQINQMTIDGDSSVEAAQARVKADGSSFTTLRDRLNNADEQLAQTVTKLDERKSQSNALSSFYKKLNQKEAVKIVCQGDSMTYGTDTVSSDRRTDAVLITDDGISTVTPQAGKTYPEALQEYLIDIYKSSITVLNKGIPGAWAQQSYEKVYIDREADAVLLMLGTNDSTIGGTPPAEVEGNIEIYIDDMRKIIRRYLSWGTAVILLTPPKTGTPSSAGLLASYRNALHSLGAEFGCPVVDTEPFMSGCNSTYYSDGLHFNAKGYTYFAARLASSFIGYGELNTRYIFSNDVLSFRGKRDGLVNNGGVLQQLASSPGTEEGTQGQGYYMEVNNGDSLFFSFKTTEDNMIAIPIFQTNYVDGTENLSIKLDFGNEQGSYPLLSALGLTPPHVKPTTSLNNMKSYGSVPNLFDNSIKLSTTTKYLAITNAGWHSFKVTHVGSGNNMFHGFVFMSYRDFMNLETLSLVKSPPVTDFSPTIQGATISGSHTYTTQIGKHFVDVIRKTVKTTIVISGTIDNTIDGNVIIPNLPKISNITTPATVSRATGFFSTGERIYAEVGGNFNFISLFKQTSSGSTTQLLGTDIRGKTITLAIDVEYMHK